MASVTPGVVVYLDEPLDALWPTWLGVLDHFLARPWAANINTIRPSNEPASQVDWAGVQRYRQQLGRGPRSHLAGELADHPEFPNTSIEFRDIRISQRGAHPRASYLRVRLPFESAIEELVWVCRLLAQSLPINQGVGGYLCHINGRCRGVSSDQVWSWARRYYGLHVVEPVAVTWDAPRGICGSNWMTIVGERWFEEGARLGPEALTALSSEESVRCGVTMQSFGQSRLLQAGPGPQLGDQNYAQALPAYSAVASALEPGFVEEPTEYLGMFSDLECTERWMRRLTDPIAWRDASQ